MPALMLLLAGCAPEPVRQTAPGEPTLADLATGAYPADVGAETDIRREQVIMAYRDYLAQYPASPERRDIRRRLADLLMETAGDTMAGLSVSGGDTAPGTTDARQRYREAITIYEQLLRDEPEHPDRGEIYYQLSRACEETGQPERAMALLDELIVHYPAADTRLYSDALFRRGELQFDAGDYEAAAASYRAVVELGDIAPVYEQSLYKLGWSLFRQEHYEQALAAFFVLLDRKLPAGVAPEARVAALAPAEQEQLADVFRAISLSFSYLEGAGSIDAWFRRAGPRDYEQRIYRNLAELYDDKALYTDAAGTRLAQAARFPDSADAPRLYIEVIRSYRQAGFRERLMETHAAFTGQYDLDRSFWNHHQPTDLPDVVEQLQSSLTELARHYHARARETGEGHDYRQAEHWYRRYLLTFPDAAQASEMRFLLGELLYTTGNYPQAVEEYEQVAYRYAQHPQAAEAGLNAVLACERQLQQAGTVDRQGWQARCDGLAIRFVDVVPRHPDAVAVLTRTGTGLIDRQQAGDVVQACGALIERGDAVPPELRRAALVLLAQAQFSREDFRAAELAYREARSIDGLDAARRATLDEAMAASIYRQAEQQRALGNAAEASSAFLRAAAAAPGPSSVRPVAQYDAAASLLAAERWDDAVRILAPFREEHPGHALEVDVTRKLAFAYEQDGRDRAAAGEYVRLAGMSGDEAIGREALLHAADLYRQAGHSADAVAVLERYLTRYPQPAVEVAEAMQRLAGIEAARGDADRHQHWLHALVKLDTSGRADDRIRELAAQAHLSLADYRITDFERLRIGEPLQQSLTGKLQAMTLAIDELEAAAGYGLVHVTTATTYRTGKLYYDLGRALLDSGRPRGLDAEELARYNLLLEQEAAPFEDKAIEFHAANLRLISTGIYDEWVAKSLAQLGELWPARYARQEQMEALVDDRPDILTAGAGYGRALAMMQTQQYAAAAGLLEAVAGAQPHLQGVELNLAIAYTRLGRDADAELALRQVLAVTPESPVAHNLQGILNRRAGRFQQSRDAYRQALRLRPDYPMAHINLGILCDIYLQNADCAMRHYREYLSLSAAEGSRVALWIADLEQRREGR